MVPSGCRDMSSEVTVDIHCLGIWTPRARQIYIFDTISACKGAVMEHIAVGRPFFGGGSRDISLPFAMNGSAVKYGS